MQHLTVDLWKRWRNEDLLLLQKRYKWKHPIRNFQPGDFILLKDAIAFQRSWPMGKVINTFKGTDGLVRAVDVLVNGKLYRRPIHKLAYFLGENDASSPRGEDVQAQDMPGNE